MGIEEGTCWDGHWVLYGNQFDNKFHIKKRPKKRIPYPRNMNIHSRFSSQGELLSDLHFSKESEHSLENCWETQEEKNSTCVSLMESTYVGEQQGRTKGFC